MANSGSDIGPTSDSAVDQCCLLAYRGACSLICPGQIPGRHARSNDPAIADDYSDQHAVAIAFSDAYANPHAHTTSDVYRHYYAPADFYPHGDEHAHTNIYAYKDTYEYAYEYANSPAPNA